MQKSDYRVRLRYRLEKEVESLWWQVENETENVLFGSGVEKAMGSNKSSNQAQAGLASVVSQKLASSRGLINIQHVKGTSDTALGNVCVLKAEIALAEGSNPSNYMTCLERTLKRIPQDSDAMAALSRILSRSNKGQSSDLSRSRLLASEALSISPSSDRASFALMKAYLHNNQREEAEIAAEQALSLNADNPDLRDAVLAAFSNGDWWFQSQANASP